MQVIDFLPAVAVTVNQQAIAIFGNALLLGDLCRHGKQTPQSKLILTSNLIGGRNQLVGNN